IVKTRSRPVISKIFVMLRSLQTSDSWPSFVRSRLTPPTRTPSVVESMNVVSLKSTITCLPPCPMTSRSCCLNSGAVYRSTSPASEITKASSPSCSVLMSKFTCAVFPSARSLTTAWWWLTRLTERPDPVPDLRLLGGVEVEGEQPLVGADRNGRLVQRVGRLGEREDRVPVPGRGLDDLLVGADRGVRGGLILDRGLLELGARLGRQCRGDRVLAEGGPELARRRGPERGTEARFLLRDRGELRFAEV